MERAEAVEELGAAGPVRKRLRRTAVHVVTGRRLGAGRRRGRGRRWRRLAATGNGNGGKNANLPREAYVQLENIQTVTKARFVKYMNRSAREYLRARRQETITRPWRRRPALGPAPAPRRPSSPDETSCAPAHRTARRPD